MLITGGGSGIGRACAERFGLEGAVVYIADRDYENANALVDSLKKAGAAAFFVPVDISDESSIRAAVEQVVAAQGRLDISVHSAGILLNSSFLDIPGEDWDRIMAVNIKGTALCTQIAAKQMVSQIPQEVRSAGKADRSFGKIVNVTSISGRRGRSYQAHYAASKAAIINITQSGALALAPYNINVNAIAPSVVFTPMWEQNDRDKAKMFGIPVGKSSDEFIDRIPLKRAGSPHDMASAVAFLSSGDSDYITGQTLNVDGGFEMC